MFQIRKIKIILALLSFSVLFTTNIVWHGLVVTGLLILTWRSFRELKNLKFWLVFLLFAFLPCIFIHTYQMFWLSCLVLCRSVIVYLALITIAKNINSDALSKNMSKIIGKRLTTILLLAFNLMPIVRNILIRNYALFYFKKTTNISRFKKTIAYVLAVLRQVLNAADCCAENMFLSQAATGPNITIITGAKHSGKTTLASTLIEKFKAKNWDVRGILAPSTMENNRRTTIYVMDIQTGEKKLLASRQENIADTAYTYGGFRFSQSGYQFATKSLLNYIPGSIVFLDEFGPLEFANMGHAADFKKLLCSNIAALYVVIREELIERFKTEFPDLIYDVIAVKHDNTTVLATTKNATIFPVEK